MTRLTLAQARQIIDVAIDKAAAIKAKPLCIAVLDEQGRMKAYAGQDFDPAFRPMIAERKAYTALFMGAGSRRLAKSAVDNPHIFAGLNSAAGGKLFPVIGGVLIRDKEGNVVGAVGIAGDTSDNDESFAADGIRSVGLVPDTGA